MKVLILFLCFSTAVGFAQNLQEVSKIALEADAFVGIDPYKNTYYIKDQVLHKNGAEGAFVFNDFQLGPITSVDIINPLKVVVFYRDVNTVVFVDNRLNEIERINFNNLPQFINVQTATNAGNNRLWIFNVDTQQIELYNYRNNTKVTVSQPFTGELISQASNFNYCFALTNNSMRTFNIYGSLLSKIDEQQFERIVQQEEKVVALKNNELYLIAENSVQPLKSPLPENTIKDLQLTQDFLYIYDSKFLYTFSLTQPKK